MKNSFDNHMLSLYQECPTKFYYRIVKGWTIRGAKGALTFGQAIHAALDERAKGHGLEASIAAFRKLVPVDLDTKRTVRGGEAMIKGYYEQYQSEPITHYLGVEEVLQVPLGPFTYVMRLDKKVRMSGMLWVMDHKTTSKIQDNTIHKAQPDDAFTGYIWGAQKQSSDEPVYGLIMDMLELPYPYKPKKGESEGKLEPKYLRVTTSRTPEELEYWERRRIKLMHEVSAMMEQAETEVWHMHTSACTNFNSRCEFHSLCLQGLPCQAVQLDDNYEVSHWEPWNQGV